jgi:uncharacterized protein
MNFQNFSSILQHYFWLTVAMLFMLSSLNNSVLRMGKNSVAPLRARRWCRSRHAWRRVVYNPVISYLSVWPRSRHSRYNPATYSTGLETKMTKLTLQEQMLKAGLVTSKKMAKVQRTAKKSRVQAREAREAVEENKKAQLERDKQLSEQQKQAALSKEYKAQVKQLIEMNRIDISRGNIDFNFTDNNLIKKMTVDKLTQTQLISGRLAIARLVDNSGESQYVIIPASVADKIAQRDANSIVLNSALSQEEQDEDDPYADFKVPDDLMW